MLSIDTTDNEDAIKQNGDEVEFSFHTMVYRLAFFQLSFRIWTSYDVFTNWPISELWLTQLVWSWSQLNQWAVRLATVLQQKTTLKLIAHQFQQSMGLLNYRLRILVEFSIFFLKRDFCRPLVPYYFNMASSRIDSCGKPNQACLWQRWMNSIRKLHQCWLAIHHIARDHHMQDF